MVGEATPYWFLAIIFAGFVIAIARVQMRNRHISTLRSSVLAQDIRLQVPVRVRTNRFGFGLGFMCLVVRTSSIEISLRNRNLGSFLGSEWIFYGGNTFIEWQGDKANSARNEWITMRQTFQGKNTEVSVTRNDRMNEIWNALIDAGAHPIGAA